MSESTKYDEPGDEDLVSDEKLFRKTMLRMHREQKEDQKLIQSQVWGDIHATPPTQGLLRDVDKIMEERVEEKSNDKWFKRVVVTALTGMGLAGFSAWIASHWN